MKLRTEVRVLVVDDSLIVRRLIGDALRDVQGVRVVGTAANGIAALAMAKELDPDIVTLDVEMPQLGGLATLRRLRADHPRVKVIMFSSLTGTSAPVAVEALASGAADCVGKPTEGGMTGARARIRDLLVPRIEAMCDLRMSAPAAPRHVLSPAARLVVVAASTGGPAALHAMLGGLPVDFATPIAIVQHIPPLFGRLLADRLALACGRAVVEVERPTEVHHGRIYLAAASRHLVVARRAGTLVVEPQDGPPEGSCRPSADALFRSAAAALGNAVLGVVLTGMGEDGLRGSEALRAVGARVFVQDAASSVVWGMPGAVARGGFADRVLPLDAMAGAVEEACGWTSQEHRAGR